jgi:hypothetical protein
MVLPPSFLIPVVVQGTMVQPAERHREGVAGLEAEAARLEKLEVMGLGG